MTHERIVTSVLVVMPDTMDSELPGAAPRMMYLGWRVRAPWDPRPIIVDMVHFRRIADDNDMPTERGTYRRVFDYWSDYQASKGRPNTYWAELCCPGCGKVALVGSNHTVADNGTVSPSDVCPFPPCTFHEFIHLDDWSRPSTPRRPQPGP